MDLERWMMGDPARVYERIETMKQRRFKPKLIRENPFHMTADESAQIEDLLTIWYEYTRAYMPKLGAPRSSVSCREYESTDVHQSGSDVDDKLDRITAESVEWAINHLDYLMQAAIGTHCRNRVSKAAVWRNPRLGTPEQAHAKYQEAKGLLLPWLKQRDLIKYCA